ncbi:hypothetical protein LINGRAPRIM_LOCUS2919 [Linum grandiflorum]
MDISTGEARRDKTGVLESRSSASSTCEIPQNRTRRRPA